MKFAKYQINFGILPKNPKKNHLNQAIVASKTASKALWGQAPNSNTIIVLLSWWRVLKKGIVLFSEILFN